MEAISRMTFFSAWHGAVVLEPKNASDKDTTAESRLATMAMQNGLYHAPGQWWRYQQFAAGVDPQR